MTAFLQLPLDARDPDRARAQRERFQQWVIANGDSARDRVVLVEPNPWLAQSLRERWVGWSDVTVLEASTSVVTDPADISPASPVEFFLAATDAPDYRSMGPHASSVRRRFPHSEVQTKRIPQLPIADVLNLAHDHAIALVAVDGLGPDLAALASCPALADVAAVAVAWNVPSRALKDRQSGALLRLRNQSLVLSGSAWGESGETSMLVRPTSLPVRVQAA